MKKFLLLLIITLTLFSLVSCTEAVNISTVCPTTTVIQTPIVSPSPTPTIEPTRNPDYDKIDLTDLVIKKHEMFSTTIFQLHPKIKNNTGDTIIAVQMLVKCKDKFGEIINSFGLDGIQSYSYQEDIKPNKGIPSDMYLTLYNTESANEFHIAIWRYRTKSGNDTIEIPLDELDWKSFKR